MTDHIHILGASGSGTSTLGRALARAFGYVHVDTDDYYWEPTAPPFQKPREREQRQALLGAALDKHARWALSGSLCGWGDVFIPRFDLVIFLTVPQADRLARLEKRERVRYGKRALAPGGEMHDTHVTFMKWAADYDDGDESMRSRRLHEKWIAALPCPCVRLGGALDVKKQVELLWDSLSGS